MAKVLITGGSGSIGRYLIPRLLFGMHQVAIIGRAKKEIPGVESYTWNLDEEELDERALNDVTHIIHLAGAGIADKPWSPARKKEIVESRVKPLQMLANALSRRNQRIEAIISSSAVGFYGGLLPIPFLRKMQGQQRISLVQLAKCGKMRYSSFNRLQLERSESEPVWF